MKRLLLMITFLFPLLASAQDKPSAADFLRRYNTLTEHVGPAGVGVETLLDKWEAAYPDDVQQMLARFSFCFTRSRTSQVIQLDRDRYLGQKPLLPFTDSLGVKRNYFEDYVYDDDLMGAALQALNQAIAARPHRLDFRNLRIGALIAYEKEAPDMSLQALKELADKHFKEKTPWEYEGLSSVGNDQFLAFMQDFCVTLFQIGSDASLEAFKSFTEYLLVYCKDDPLFVNNLGSYYLVKRDFKQARKYIDKVLKKHPKDTTAIQNGILLARALKDKKLESKYRNLMAKSL